MAVHTLRRDRHHLTPLISVSAAAAVFAVLLVLVRLRWAPLESIDRGTASHLNSLVAGHSLLVTIIKGITWLGSDGVLWVVIIGASIILAVRRRWRLTIYLLATGAGAIVLDPILKSLVGRLRPVVAHPIAHGTGSSFPSGHSLGSIVCYGALFLVFVPATRGRWRTAFTTVILALIALIGISRLLLGVHYLSDVIGAWAIGIAWLGLTAFAFELSRQAAGQPATAPVTEGLEPEAEADLKPAEPQTAATRAANHPGRTAAAVGVCWILIVGIIVGIGELVTKYGNGNVLGDHTIPHWLAAHRSSGWTWWSALFSSLGSTIPIQLAILTTAIVFLAVYRRWRPAIFMFTLILGELFAFLITEYVVKRPRPDVHNMDAHLPTSAYPSGHVAATTCVYIGIAILVLGHTRGWWRWLFVALAVIMPVCVIASRVYRGEHHPTDVLGSLVFAALWLTTATLLIHPNRDVGQHVTAATDQGRS
ncbi:MAG TPA: phosphatase PAP2 family protein [Micromonosporaceae bacterium]|jgi:undecaprenyl-diphosphatase